jgi:hypothetical protein
VLDLVLIRSRAVGAHAHSESAKPVNIDIVGAETRERVAERVLDGRWPAVEAEGSHRSGKQHANLTLRAAARDRARGAGRGPEARFAPAPNAGSCWDAAVFVY